LRYSKEQLQQSLNDFGQFIKMVGGEDVAPIRLKIARDLIKRELDQTIKITCAHKNLEKTEYGGSVCKDCGTHQGWYCPKSPDNRCYYFSHLGKIIGRKSRRYVRLNNGTIYYLPEKYDGRNESDDWCIFCGAPEERK
jgi:hypothetical protein